jgi:hypothetical protein
MKKTESTLPHDLWFPVTLREVKAKMSANVLMLTIEPLGSWDWSNKQKIKIKIHSDQSEPRFNSVCLQILHQ